MDEYPGAVGVGCGFGGRRGSVISPRRRLYITTHMWCLTWVHQRMKISYHQATTTKTGSRSQVLSREAIIIRVENASALLSMLTRYTKLFENTEWVVLFYQLHMLTLGLDNPPWQSCQVPSVSGLRYSYYGWYNVITIELWTAFSLSTDMCSIEMEVTNHPQTQYMLSVFPTIHSVGSINGVYYREGSIVDVLLRRVVVFRIMIHAKA